MKCTAFDSVPEPVLREVKDRYEGQHTMIEQAENCINRSEAGLAYSAAQLNERKELLDALEALQEAKEISADLIKCCESNLGLRKGLKMCGARLERCSNCRHSEIEDGD